MSPPCSVPPVCDSVNLPAILEADEEFRRFVEAHAALPDYIFDRATGRFYLDYQGVVLRYGAWLLAKHKGEVVALARLSEVQRPQGERRE